MDALPAILIFVPIIHPLAVAVGIHPVHLGVIVVMTQSFGLLTPPLGMVAMTACAVAGVPMMKIQNLLHIMMIPLLIVIVLCALAPWTVLALPKLLFPSGSDHDAVIELRRPPSPSTNIMGTISARAAASRGTGWRTVRTSDAQDRRSGSCRCRPARWDHLQKLSE
jgi:hypothetical protein